MKMSPWRSQGELEFGFAVIKRDVAIESLVEIDFSASEAEATTLGRDLKASAFPLHDIVVADNTGVNEAADPVQIGGSRAPGGGGFSRTTGEATIVVSDKTGQDGIGRVQIASLGQTELAGEAVLQHAPESFDAALGLWAASGDEGDAELFQGATDLGGIAFAGELFGDGPGVVVADEDRTVIAVKGQRDAIAAQQLAQEHEVAEGGFGGKELSGEDFAGGIILQSQGGEPGAAALEPVVGRAVELHQFAFPSRAQAALAMSRSAALAGRTQTRLAQETAKSLAAEGQTLDLAKFFTEMVIVKAGIDSARQPQNGAAHLGRQAAMAGTPAVGVCQSRLSLLPQTLFETTNLTNAEREQFGGSGTRQVSFNATRYHTHSLQFLLTQRERPSSHGVTFSRCC